MQNTSKDMFRTQRAELRELGKYKNPLKIPIPLWLFLCISITFGLSIYLEISSAYSFAICDVL